jgi:hypothetical protein
LLSQHCMCDHFIRVREAHQNKESYWNLSHWVVRNLSNNFDEKFY